MPEATATGATSEGQASNDTRRVALITGCSEGGIGFALAKCLGETGRYRVFATARNVDKMRALPAAVERLALDVTSDASVKAAVNAIVNSTPDGRIDVLINNAGVNAAVGPAVETPLKNIEHTVDVNLYGTIRVTQAVAKHMIAHAKKKPDEAGMIVNLGSIAGVLALPYSAGYSASKAAVHVYTDCMRLELAPFGIKCLCITPGKIKSSVGDTAAAQMDKSALDHYKHMGAALEHRAQYSQRGKPEPMDTDNFAQVLLRHMEAHGSLGRDARPAWQRLLHRFSPTGGEYLAVGPLAGFLLRISYYPVWIRDRILSRMFDMSALVRTSDEAKKNK